mgnify:CR=1 FL=1
MDEESRVDQESGSVLEDPVTPQLAEMLVPMPYQAPEKKGKKKGKEPKGGPDTEVLRMLCPERQRSSPFMSETRTKRRRRWRATPLAS